MKNNYTTLEISIQEAKAIVLDLYGIEGELTKLDGYDDFNFRVKTSNKDQYILKISRPKTDLGELDFQQKLLEHIASKESILVPKVMLNKEKEGISTFFDTQGEKRAVRLLSWIKGRLWSAVNPQTDALRQQLGQNAGKLTKALEDFDHPQAHRVLEWDNAQVTWVYDYLHLFEGRERVLMEHFHALIKARLPKLLSLRKSVVHNDVNDNNIVVSKDLKEPKVLALIDYGDAIYTPIINDLGVAGMYLPMYQPDALGAILPFVKGYHESFALEEEELELLYSSIAMRLVISITKTKINKEKEPENEYQQINAQTGWTVLEQWYALNEAFATYSFRAACGFVPHPEENTFKDWAKQESFKLTDLFPSVLKTTAKRVDLGLESTLIGRKDDFNNVALMTYRLSELEKQSPKAILAGGYLEPRFLYTTNAYRLKGNEGYEYRSIHIGTDFWLPAQTPVHVLTDGEVVSVYDNGNDKDYGPTIIIKHKYNTNKYFYTLYGHLSRTSLTQVEVGQKVKKGALIAWLGSEKENGTWTPHLHFQVMLDLLGNKVDFPGVACPSQVEVWKSICPNTNCFFELPDLEPIQQKKNKDLIDYRKTHLGKGLSLQYKVPLKMVRGDGAYLLDQYGQKYLDTVNNVAHVGHEHPKIVEAGQNQMAILNTNSRYLHDNINAFAEALLATLPEELSVLHFVNSGSEANELALRMLKTATGEKDIIASEVGYHGNTNACIEISSYKFDGNGGAGAPEHTHIFPLPDVFRGKHRGADARIRYVEEVEKQIQKVQGLKRNVAGLIIEPIISCGGQIELPEGFLKAAYAAVRAAGGYCISDEVQVGCGRVGKAFWGFQLHDVIPDIVTIGKPLGNGHPLAAVACTRELADKFANGMEYFNTFGGNPVSCAIGLEVLQTVKREGLQENALNVGNYLKEALKTLAKNCPIIGDVRGEGLFLGFELVDKDLNPLPEKTDYLANRMKAHKILMSVDGPQHNVLKIKPPMVFNLEQAQELIQCLGKIFAEDFMLV
jgi:4-aminobutyrate aminotransferase-like enzyme/Ser/Thr protein kinase RdoA (MazF antagonist)